MLGGMVTWEDGSPAILVDLDRVDPQEAAGAPHGALVPESPERAVEGVREAV
jgi:hypothetical protein